MMSVTMGGMSELRTITMNDGRTVVQPKARAQYLVTRRLAEYADDVEPEVLTPLEAPADEPKLDDLSKDELIEQATARDLPTYGTKAQLIERITDHDNQTPAQLSATDDESVGANAEDEPLSESDSDGSSQG